MILSYADRRTADFANGRFVKGLGSIQRAAEKRLERLETAKTLGDLTTPGNRLEMLKGDRKGQYSIRINDQWRICFYWPGGANGPSKVEIVDYH